MSDEKPKIPEMTPEQKEAMDAVKDSVAKFNHMVSFYLFNQLHIIEDGKIHVDLEIEKHRINKVQFHSSFARDMTDDGQKD